MAGYTEHYNLELPANVEHYDIKVANTNNKIIDEKLYEKVEKIPNKGLSTNDFTNGYKQKLDSLKNYDDTQIKKNISNIQKEQITQNTDISNIKKEQETQNTNIEENNSKIVELQTEKAKLETELKEIQEDFYQNSIRGQASGEYIHVEDSSNCRARIGIGGNSEQETREGYNLLNANLPYTTSSSGNTIKWLGKENIPKIEVNKYYYLHGKFSDGTIFSGAHAAFVITDSMGQILNKSFRSSFQNTVDISNATDCYIYTDSTYVNKTVTEVAIYEGKENKAYEQYGASPSPDYPSEIKTVGSNVNILIPKKYNNQTINGVTLNSNVDGSITLNGTMEEAGTIGIVDTTFSISKDSYGFSIGETKLNSFNIFIQKTDYTNIMLLEIGRTTAQVIKELDAMSIKSVNMYINKGTVFNNYVIKPKLEKKRVTTYSPYSMGSVKVTKCNKNLFDKNTTTDGKLISSSGSIQAEPAGMCSDYIQIKTSANYYISGRTSLSSIALYDKNKTFLERISTTQPNGVLNITNSNCKYIIINALLTNKDTLQIEEKTATAYEEHQEQSYIMPIQQPMRSIGDIRDTFIKKNNKWYERHYIARRIFNGIANKFNSKHSSIYTDARGLYQLNLPGKILGTNGSVAYGKSNYLKYKNGNAMDAIYQDCLWWENTSNYNYASIPFLSLTEANEWLVKLNDNGNPFYIDYVLAEPLDIECTEKQSNILDELNNARTYKNVTNITTDSKAILSLDYAKDLETLLNNTQALAVNNASEGV